MGAPRQEWALEAERTAGRRADHIQMDLVRKW